MFKNGVKNNVLTQNVVVYDEAKSNARTLSKSGFARKMAGPSLDKLVSKFRAINERRAKQPTCDSLRMCNGLDHPCGNTRTYT